jgi:hypothetical protein
MAETRKLAAIPAADVVGYSRLAGSDEERTQLRLNINKLAREQGVSRPFAGASPGSLRSGVQFSTVQF